MNKIFKIIKNQSGNNVVASELAKGVRKGSKLATTLLTVLGASSAMAAPISIQGTATSENAVSIGSNSFATAVDGVANGQGSVATGKGFNRDDFTNKVKEQNNLIDGKTEKQNELDEINVNLDINDKVKNNLVKQINDLTNLINQATDKGNQVSELNNQLIQKELELTSLQNTLQKEKIQALTTSATGSGDKTIWTDFTAQLGKVDWNKLSDTSNGSTGVNKVALDLRNMVEADYPEYTNQWSIDKYEEIIGIM